MEHKKDDIRYLKEKVDCGVDFITTQMFFNNDIFYNFLYRIREQGISTGASGNHARSQRKSSSQEAVPFQELLFRRDSVRS